MPGLLGITYVCDRCGKTHFIEGIESIPEDWIELPIDKMRPKYICPTCAVPFKRFMTWFFEKGQCPDEWREKE